MLREDKVIEPTLKKEKTESSLKYLVTFPKSINKRIDFISRETIAIKPSFSDSFGNTKTSSRIYLVFFLLWALGPKFSECWPSLVSITSLGSHHWLLPTKLPKQWSKHENVPAESKISAGRANIDVNRTTALPGHSHLLLKHDTRV